MKTSAVLASLLFGSFAVAAPVDKRALALKTEVVWQTVVVYTTVYDDDNYVPEATSTPAGYFYERPPKPTTAAAKPTAPAPAPAPVDSPKPVEKPSKAPASSAPAPSSAAPVEQPKPVESPQPATSAAYVAPSPAPAPAAPTSAYVAPAPAASSPVPKAASSGSGSGSYSNVDVTVYDATGSGACGTTLDNSQMVVAISKDAWGSSTYDVMTGAATNKWCGQKIIIELNGRKEQATIMDMCPGCSGHDIDLSGDLWKKLTPVPHEQTRLKGSWSMA